MRKFGSDHTGVGRSIVYGEAAGVPGLVRGPRVGAPRGRGLGRGVEITSAGGPSLGEALHRGSGWPGTPTDPSRALLLYALSPAGVKQKDGQELSNDLDAQVTCPLPSQTTGSREGQQEGGPDRFMVTDTSLKQEGPGIVGP